MTEEEFYQHKIFNNASVLKLKKEYPLFKEEIKTWYNSPRCKRLLSWKSFLENKVKQMEEAEVKIAFSRIQVYQLFN